MISTVYTQNETSFHAVDGARHRAAAARWSSVECSAMTLSGMGFSTKPNTNDQRLKEPSPG